ncbi:MAG TPA: VOC family protein [Thermohalobaculum sp.]|nr:VOC family protein [Thermohalobaculum sp.]
MSQHGTIHWSELITGDVTAAKTFFKNIAGWQINEMPMPNGTYNVCMAGEKPVAGIMSGDMMGQPDHPPTWMTYIAVDDVDAACAKTGKTGGKILKDPFDIPNIGRIAMINDPTGAVVGLITPAPHR